MKKKNSYQIRSFIVLLIICVASLIGPAVLFPENALIMQITAFTIIYSVERYLVYKNLKLSFEAFENALDVLRKLLPAYIAKNLHFSFDIYKPSDGKATAENIKDAIDEILSEQSKMMKKYETLNSDLTHYVNAQQILLDIAHEMISINDTDALYDLFLKKAIELVPGAQKGSILLMYEGEMMSFVASKGFDLDRLKSLQLNAYDSFLSLNRTTLRTEPYIINNMNDHNTSRLDEKNLEELLNITGVEIRSTLTAPILVDGEIYGMINLDSEEKDAFKNTDITSMLFFTSQLGIAIKNRQLIDKTLYLSQYDRLTGIYNRSYFEENFYEYHKKVLSGKMTFILLLMDLNYLKKINDTFGHIAGDKALRTFVTEIQKDLPEDALVARYGGDEFIALLPNLNYNEAFHIMNASIDRFKNVSMPFNNIEVPIRYSFGLSASPDESMVMDILVKIADQRMYKHKTITKNDEPHIFESLMPPDILEL